jgi:hypothetical protein
MVFHFFSFLFSHNNNYGNGVGSTKKKGETKERDKWLRKGKGNR